MSAVDVLELPSINRNKTVERTALGRFLKGSKGGPGNPLVKYTQRLRAALAGCVTEQDMVDVTMRMLRDAKNGDAAARHELYDRVFGKATQPIELATDNGQTINIVTILHNPRFLDMATTLAKQMTIDAEFEPSLAGPTDIQSVVIDAQDKK